MTTRVIEMCHLNALPSHWMALAMEEFPQLIGSPRFLECKKARSILQKKIQVSCCKIAEEVDEEGPFAVEEDKARRYFLQSLESLRRCTQARQ